MSPTHSFECRLYSHLSGSVTKSESAIRFGFTLPFVLKGPTRFV
nr:MAG TPA: hypothetical protein [Caudoviricetes sp.]